MIESGELRGLARTMSHSPVVAGALAAAADEIDRLGRQSDKLLAELEDEIGEKTRIEEWADALAYAIAPVEVIGEHSSRNNPWQNALVEIDRLRARIDGDEAVVESLTSQRDRWREAHTAAVEHNEELGGEIEELRGKLGKWA